MIAIAAPLAAPLFGPGAQVALGGLLVGTGALLRELMLREDLSPQFFDFRRSQDLENIGGPTIRLSDVEILQRLLEDAIKTPVGFPSPPNLPEILGPWLQDVYDFWIAKPDQDWGQLNSRTFTAPGPGQGEWSIGPANEIEFTFQYDLIYTYPLGDGSCLYGADGPPKTVKYEKQRTDTFTDVDFFTVQMQDVTLNRICGATDTPSGQSAPYRTMTVTQDGFDYVTENMAETGTEIVTGDRSPRTQVQMGRALSIKKNGVEQLVPIPRIPVPGIDASPGTRQPTSAGPMVVDKAYSPAVTPVPNAEPVIEASGFGVPTVTPTFPAYLPAAPPIPEELTNFGQPVPAAVAQTSPTTHVINTGEQVITVPAAGARANPQLIANEIGRIEQKAGDLLRGLGGSNGSLGDLAEILLLLQGLAGLFEQKLPAVTYSLTGICEETEEGAEQPATSVILPPEILTDRLVSLGDMMPTLLQAHKDYKQPVCTPEKPELLGDWVTTRWISDEKMDHSGRRLRKLFRYRSQSTRNLGQLSSYWECFVWQAGPVCVRHQGAWWGDPQVWAKSADEGKRVIRHAAAEAGIDPDKTGRWAISGSRSPRYGMSGTMKIHLHKGFPWVASRDGSDWPNVLAKGS